MSLANLEAEQALLGALIAAPECGVRVADILAPEQFSESLHGEIYRRIAEQVAISGRVDVMALRSLLELPAYAAIGGAAYLSRLAQGALTVERIEDYARHVADLWRRREIAAAAVAATSQAASSPSGAVIIELQAVIDRLQARGVERGLRPFYESVDAAAVGIEEAARRGSPVMGIASGLAALDAMTGGLMPGETTILAGRPSMGKSALAGHMAIHAAVQGHRVALFHHEMSALDFARRAIAAEIRLPYDGLRRGQPADDLTKAMVAAAAERLSALPLMVDESASLTVGEIAARCRRLKLTAGVLGLVVVDYLQLVRAAERYAGQRVHEVGEVSAGLRALAKSMGCPVLIVSQLNRQSEARDDKRPQLADLRDSGAIEQDADVVLMLYREEYYLERTPEPEQSDQLAELMRRRQAARNVAEILVAKNRHGRTGTVRVYADLATARFADLAPPRT